LQNTSIFAPEIGTLRRF